MKSTIAILLIFLIASSSCTSLYDKYPMNFSPERSIMTMMTQVEAHLKSGAPLDAVQKLLGDFVRAVTQEQIQHDQLYEAQKQECDSEFSFREREIQDAESAFKTSSETLQGCEAQHHRAIADFSMAKQELKQTQAYLEVIVDTRRRDQKAFETATQVYQLISRAVDEALNILDEIWNGSASFIQIAKHANKMLKDSVKIRKAHLLAPVMNALAQISRGDLQADSTALQRIKSMLFAYRERIEEEYQQKAAAEAEFVNQFQITKSTVDTNIANLENQLIELEQEISDLNKCILTQTGIRASAAAKRDRNTRLLHDAQALCTSIEHEYVSSTESRRQELSLLAQIRERVEQRFSQLSEGVKHRGSQDSWSHHNNYVGFLQEDEQQQ